MKTKQRLTLFIAFLIIILFSSEHIYHEAYDHELQTEYIGVKTDTESRRVLMVSGDVIGISFQCQGPLVIGTGNILNTEEDFCPAKQRGISIGDIIIEVNGNVVTTAAQIKYYVENCSGDGLLITYIRDGRSQITAVDPAFDDASGNYRIGLWLRDSFSGIGTLTYYDPASDTFAALGHGISDADTGLIPNHVLGGIFDADILGIKKGVIGTPGEIRGTYSQNEFPLGETSTNNQFGVYGKIEEHSFQNYKDNEKFTAYEVGGREEVKKGEAYILCDPDNSGSKLYSIEIEILRRQEKPDTKSLSFHVTDERLIELTGGIIQGMSGSPIIQNEKIVGAVTHVTVSDPLMGYGIYIEWMLACTDSMIDSMGY